MASKEYIKNRIAGKEKEVEKLEKKQARIEKAKASDWKENPYYYSESDLRRCLKDLEVAKQSLAEYQRNLAFVEEKENSRNVKVILDFLEAWKIKVMEFYEENEKNWIITLHKLWEAQKIYCDWTNSHFSERKNAMLVAEMKAPVEEAESEHNQYKYLNRYMEHGKEGYHLVKESLKKDLDEEANRKYDFIIERTNAIVGEITDASFLSIGPSGDLNGFIIGTRGKANVNTIGAGGYNIQCYHFRTLITEVKERGSKKDV